MRIIFSAIILTSNQNASEHAEEATFRQQAKELQNALENWVITRPSMHAAITDWNTDPSAQGILNRAAPMLAFESRGHFDVSGTRIVTSASQKRGYSFVVSWGANDAEKLVQGPIVTLWRAPEKLDG